jgi:membrane protein implicated in regulation of membrane protease activity
MMLVIWVVAGLALVAVELHTIAFYSIFLAAGCFAAGLLTLFVPDSPVWVQALLAAVVSLIGLVALRPFASRTFLHGSGGVVSRGVHGGLVGQEALTVDTVGDEHHPGHVQLAGERWLAVTDHAPALAADTAVTVTAVRGTTLLVRPLKQSAGFEQGGVGNGHQ